MTTKEALEQRDAILDEYEKGVGLPTYHAPGDETELQFYLSLDRKALENMDTQECGVIEYRLALFAFHMQRAQNREIARVTWAKNELRMTIASELNNYKGYGYEEKSSQAIKGNDHAHKLNNILIYAQQRVDRLNFLSNGLRNLADILKSIGINKRQKHD